MGADEAAGGQLVATALTARQGKGPDSGATGTLVAYALRRDPDGTGQGHNTNYVTHALTAEGTGSGASVMASAGTAVRRLTPTECERLQGFPDGWTATSWGKPQSDSARYRQLGNAVATPVIAWIGHRLVAVDPEVRSHDHDAA